MPEFSFCCAAPDALFLLLRHPPHHLLCHPPMILFLPFSFSVPLSFITIRQKAVAENPDFSLLLRRQGCFISCIIQIQPDDSFFSRLAGFIKDAVTNRLPEQLPCSAAPATRSFKPILIPHTLFFLPDSFLHRTSHFSICCRFLAQASSSFRMVS